MSKINIQILNKEAIETIKANLDKFTKLVEENPINSDVLIAELPEKCFIEKNYMIDDFELNISDDGDYSKVDFDNAIILYEHLKELPKYVLGDEGFWMWVLLKKGYAAAVQAMPMSSGKNIIKDHWLFGQGRRRGLMYGVLSRKYYRVYLTRDDSLNEQYALTKFATENYYRYREFTWRSYSNNRNIVIGALKAEKKMVEKYGENIEKIKGYYPSIASYISKLGSVMLLDSMSEDYIMNSVESFCEELICLGNNTP